MIDTLVSRFKFYDFNIEKAGDGLEALKKAHSTKPDLIILDVTMPKINGWDVCRELKSSPEFKTTPVIILTGKSKDDDMLKSYERGADDFLAKPVEFDDLMHSIKRLLSKKK